MGKKSVNNLYKPMLEHSNVEQKFHKAAKGKTERPDVAVILEPTNIQRHVKNVVEQLENTAPEGYDIPHPEKAWKPSRHGKVCINEGTSRKVRMIEKPRYNYEQVIHQLKAVHYIRYMDDMVVFGKNKKELHRMQQEIERFLREKFNLQMKGNWQVFRFDYTEKKTGKRKGRPLDFMGFQFYHDKTILRESIMLSCTRKVNRVAKKEKITWYDATAILSYMGYLSNTDTYDMYLQRVKPYVNVKKLKKIVSKHSKRKEREKHERMERSVRNGGRTAGGVRHNSVTDNGISETQYQESNERGCRRKENHRMAARGA